MDVVEALKAQVSQEIGDDELTKDQKNMLLQKYGIVAPQLTASEMHLIKKEERQ